MPDPYGGDRPARPSGGGAYQGPTGAYSPTSPGYSGPQDDYAPPSDGGGSSSWFSPSGPAQAPAPASAPQSYPEPPASGPWPGSPPDDTRDPWGYQRQHSSWQQDSWQQGSGQSPLFGQAPPPYEAQGPTYGAPASGPGYGDHGYGDQAYGTSGYGPQNGYRQESYGQNGYSRHNGYGDLADNAPANSGSGYYGTADNGTAYNGAGYNQAGFSDPGYGAEGHRPAGDYGAQDYAAQDYAPQDYAAQDYAPQDYAAQDYGTQDYGTQGYGSSGPRYPSTGDQVVAPGGYSPSWDSPSGPPQVPGAPPAPGAPWAPEAPPVPEPPQAQAQPPAPASPTRAEQRPDFAQPEPDQSPFGQSPFGQVPNGQEPTGGPRHAAPQRYDEPQLYDAAQHQEALYRRARMGSGATGTHRQPVPAADAPPPGTGASYDTGVSYGTGTSYAPGSFSGGPYDDGPQPTQTFGPGDYDTPPGGPSYGGPSYGASSYGGLSHGGPSAPADYDGPGYQPEFGHPGQRDRAGGGGGGTLPGNRKSRTKALVGGAIVIAAGAGIGGAVIAPHLSGPSSDPGCKAYTATALPAYNHTVSDLNSKARRAALTADLTSAINDLTSAEATAQSGSVKSALEGLRGQLAAVRTDVKKGYIPSSAVAALNSASHTADDACLAAAVPGQEV